MRIAAALVNLAFALPAEAQVLETPAEFQMPVATAMSRGVGLFVHDVATARASDELMRRKIFERDDRLQGWLTDIPAKETAVIVTFVGDEAGVPAALYRVRVSLSNRKPEFEALQPAVPLAGAELARWTARQTALGEINQLEERCAPSFNTVVLSPDPAPDGLIHVYALAATDQPGLIVAGGHWRFDFSPDGKLLEYRRAFTKSCFNVEVPDKAEAQAFILTHLLDPTPTEIHVFLSRLHDRGIYVGTEYGVWGVMGGQVVLLDVREQEVAPAGK